MKCQLSYKIKKPKKAPKHHAKGTMPKLKKNEWLLLNKKRLLKNENEQVGKPKTILRKKDLNLKTLT